MPRKITTNCCRCKTEIPETKVIVFNVIGQKKDGSSIRKEEYFCLSCVELLFKSFLNEDL